MNILIISGNAFSNVTNNGKTIESIFSSFDKTELNQLFFRPHDDFIDYKFASSYYVVSEIDIVKKIINPFYKCGKKVDFISKDNNSLKLYHAIQKNSIKNYFFLRDFLWSTKLWKTQAFKAWCKEINPDAVFTVAGNSNNVHIVSRFVSKYLNIPLITFFTDDYIIYPKRTSFYAKLKHVRMKQYYKKTIQKSSMLFSISDVMSLEYNKYFGKKFHTIMNSADLCAYTESHFEANMTVSYFGGLHLNRWQMICEFSKIVPNNVIINVYSQSEYSTEIISAFKKHNVNYYSAICEKNKLQKAMQNSNALLHVESDNAFYRSLTRLSVSTKISEYLISGRLVIGYGPSEVASMRILSDNNIGLVISSEESIINSKSKLNSALTNKEYMKNMGLVGYNYAVQNFNKETISSDFKNKIQTLI